MLEGNILLSMANRINLSFPLSRYYKNVKYVQIPSKAFCISVINSMWPADAFWLQRFWPSLVQEMAFCLFRIMRLLEVHFPDRISWKSIRKFSFLKSVFSVEHFCQENVFEIVVCKVLINLADDNMLISQECYISLQVSLCIPRSEILICWVLAALITWYCQWYRPQCLPCICALQWRHYEHKGVSNHQPHDCLLDRLFKAKIKRNIKAPRNWPLCGEFTGDKGPVTRKMFPFDDIIVTWAKSETHDIHSSQGKEAYRYRWRSRRMDTLSSPALARW